MSTPDGRRVTSRRPDIQLLRGVAVLGVMLAHFGALVPGGFLGVDVFFVISGFVITLSVWSLHTTQTTSRRFLAVFWRRRFFRLVPVLVVVLAATLLGASLSLPPSEFGDQVEMSIWSLFFAGNVGVEIVTNGDYFDPGVEENWMLHLWSLGVEEQFYLIFPFIFLTLIASSWARRRKGRPFVVVVSLLVASFALSLVNDADLAFGWGGAFTESTGLSALFGYYSPLTRAWQFLLGVLAALIVLNSGTMKRRWLSFLAAAVLVVSFALVPESNLLPGFPTVLPMLAVFLLLLSPLPKKLVGSQPLRPLSWLGDRSYSAYLWHWPVWLFLGHHVGREALTIPLAFAITLALSALSYRFVELPFIGRGKTGGTPSLEPRSVPTGPRRGTSNAVLIGLIILPLLVGVGTITAHTTLEQRGVLRASPPVPQIDERIDCLETDCSDKNIGVLLIGDSHAGSLANALGDSLAAQDVEMYGAIVARHFGCLHLPSTAVTSINEECQDLSAQVRDLVTTKRPPVVLIHGYTAGRFTEINSGGDAEIKLIDNTTGQTVTAATGVDAYRKSLTDTLETVEASGAQVVIVSGVPDFTLRPEEVGRSGEPASQAELLLAPWFDFEFGQSITRDQYLDRHGDFIAVERQLASQSPSVTWLEPWDFMCEKNSCSQSSDDGEFLYSDHDHVSELGATRLADGITRHLSATGFLELARSGG